MIAIILLVLEIQRFKSVKACRPKARQAKVNANSSTNSLKFSSVFSVSSVVNKNKFMVFRSCPLVFG
ncbi:MAG: hypothetical protein LBP59_16265 [Planctomycetaceae bacterium]|nr:hypothetical protein [Planctomycetaceae bacterium]